MLVPQVESAMFGQLSLSKPGALSSFFLSTFRTARFSFELKWNAFHGMAKYLSCTSNAITFDRSPIVGLCAKLYIIASDERTILHGATFLFLDIQNRCGKARSVWSM